MPTRKNVNSLTTTEKQELVSALLALKASGKYDEFVLSHANANMAAIHRGPAFLPWHRQYILEFEEELRQVSGNLDFALPYWNWAEDFALPDPMNAPVWQSDLLGGNGDINDGNIVKTGPFRFGSWQIVNSAGGNAGPLRRDFGSGIATLPSQSDIDLCLAETEYDNSPWNMTSLGFRNRLEGWLSTRGEPELHNRGHVWVGGSMLPSTSPNDPIFYLHHCFVDLIWAQWQANRGPNNYLPLGGGPSGQNLNDLMWPTPNSTARISDVLGIFNLGYDYDVLLDPDTGGGDTGGGDTGGGDTGGGDTGGGDTGGGDTGGGDTGGGDTGGGDTGGGDAGGGDTGGGDTGGGDTGGGDAGGGDTGGGSGGSGCASMIVIILLLLSFAMLACTQNSEKAPVQKNFELIENQELTKGVYWHFDKVKSTDKNLLIIDNGNELIHLEVKSNEKFELDFSKTDSEGYIIDKDGQGFPILSGSIEGKINENTLIIEGEISGANNDSPESRSKGYTVSFENSTYKAQ